MKNKILTITILSALSTPVMAGFEFTAPIETPQNNQALTPMLNEQPQMPAVPAITVEQTPVAPVPMIISAPSTPLQIAPQPSFAPSVPMNRPTAIAPTPPMAQPQPAPAIQQPSSLNDLAVGFGKDLPLVTAMRQIIPADYTYVMDQDIETGASISWQGGQPWPIVLDNALSQKGLRSEIDGKIIRIKSPVMAQTPSAPIQIASAPQYQAPPIMNDAQPQFNTFTPTQPVLPVRNVASTPQPSTVFPQQAQAPMNILAPQLQAQSIMMNTTETEDLEKLNESIVPDVTRGDWMAQSGASLKTVLESWSNIEGVDLFWSADYDYSLAGDVNISGNFEEAVEEILTGFSAAKPKPTGRLHPNLPHGPAVLVIEAKEITDS